VVLDRFPVDGVTPTHRGEFDDNFSGRCEIAMTAERGSAIQLDDFPNPVIAYVVEGNDVRIATTNDAFETVFDTVPSEASVSTVFDRFSVVNTPGDEGPVTHLLRGDCVGISLDGRGELGPFFVRVIPSDEDAGYLVFSNLRQYPAIEDSTAVDQVSSVISHDLRNPLDVAKANLQAARETGDPELFESVSNAHDRMERIIRDVLTMTRDRPIVDPPERVSIETAAKEAWQSVDTDEATLDMTETLPTATADPDRVRRLFENLFRNSVEQGSRIEDQSVGRGDQRGHTRGVTITVGTLENGFYVADDGPGIPPEKRDAVFDPGYSTRDRGTGLGLAIVERIAAAHGWELTLTTAGNGGARFEIRL